MLSQFDLNDLPGEWRSVYDTPEAQTLVQELDREMPEEHALRGRHLIAVAVRRNLKDTVFWLPETSEWVHAHLSQRAETDSRWPSVFVASDWQALVDELI